MLLTFSIDNEICLNYFQSPQLCNQNILPVSTIVYLTFTLRSRHVLHLFRKVGGGTAFCPEGGERRRKKLGE